MEITVQDGRITPITNLILGTDALAGATILTLTTVPTIGNLLKEGVVMAPLDTITVQEIDDGNLSYATGSGVLGSTSLEFDSGTYTLDIVVIIGIIGNLFIIAKVSPPPLLLTDDIPREIPPVLANKLAHGIAARVLDRGDRSSDAKLAASNGAQFFSAKLEALGNINRIAGKFKRMHSI